MADEDLDEEDFDEEDEDLEGEDLGDEDAPPSKGSKKKLLIIIGLALFLVVGGAAAAYFTGLLQPVIEAITGEVAEAEGEGGEAANEGDGTLVGEAVFLDLEEMMVNINTGGRKSTFLKIKVALELENPADIEKIRLVMPEIIDNFQVYLRELRIEDLKGSAGMYRLREELLIRVSAAAAPIVVNDVLFKEMLVQ